MSAFQKTHGQAGPVLISSEQAYDPNSGWQTTQTYKGSQDDINALAAAYNSLGWRTSNKTTGSQWLELTVSIPEFNGSGEVPVDRYEINMDYVQTDVFLNPKFIDSLLKSGGDFQLGSLQAIADNRAAIEKAMANGHNSQFATRDGFNARLFTLLGTGFKFTERERPVLVRNRTFSLNYSNPVELNAVPLVYTTDALVSSFGIPFSVRNQLPDNPSYEPPEHTKWGWKKRRDNSEIIPAQNKVHEVKDWVFDAWSTYAYDFVGS